MNVLWYWKAKSFTVLSIDNHLDPGVILSLNECPQLSLPDCIFGCNDAKLLANIWKVGSESGDC